MLTKKTAFKKNDTPSAGPDSVKPTEGFGEDYAGFLTGMCGASLASDGTYRNAKGARFCSCDKCGLVSEMNIGGRELCIFHFGHTSQPGEADFWTGRLKNLRSLVVIIKAMPQEPDMVEELSKLFDSEIARLGLKQREDGQSAFRYLVELLEGEFKEQRAKDLKRGLASASSRANSVAERMRRLTRRIRSMTADTPRFDDVPF